MPKIASAKPQVRRLIKGSQSRQATSKSKHSLISHRDKSGQSAMEYLMTYGWAVLLIAVISSLLYLYITVPHVIVPTTCNFISGAYCNDLVVGSNATTHVSMLAVFLTNTQSYPILNPKLSINVNGVNTSAQACKPNYVLPGGAIICQVQLPVQEALGAFVSGKIYLNASYCGLVSNYTPQGCASAPRQTYIGSFTSHTAPLVSTKSSITLRAGNSTQSAISSVKDPLYATVKLLGYPTTGATVNFTATFVNGTNAVPPYSISPPITTTNTTGVALSYIYGSKVAKVNVTAGYAGYTNTTTINFTPPIILTFSLSNNMGSLLSSSSATVATIDGIGYDYSQLGTLKFACSINSKHYLNFSQYIYPVSNERLVFNNATISGVLYTTPNITVTCINNETVNANYYTQYYFTELASPSGAGSVSPGSGWYNASHVLTISEVPNANYVFQDWTCSGTGCYSGTLSSTKVTLNNPISETANFRSLVSSTSVYSTSVSSTSVSSTSVSSTSISSTTLLSTSVSSTSVSSTTTYQSSSSVFSTTTYQSSTSVSSTSVSSTTTYIYYYSTSISSTSVSSTSVSSTSVSSTSVSSTTLYSTTTYQSSTSVSSTSVSSTTTISYCSCNSCMTSSVYAKCTCPSSCSYEISDSCSTGYLKCVASAYSTSLSTSVSSTTTTILYCTSGNYWTSSSNCNFDCGKFGNCDYEYYCSSGALTGSGCTQSKSSTCSPAGCTIG
jgi:hypothetical protein